jgi:hypothetical protein
MQSYFYILFVKAHFDEIYSFILEVNLFHRCKTSAAALAVNIDDFHPT